MNNSNNGGNNASNAQNMKKGTISEGHDITVKFEKYVFELKK